MKMVAVHVTISKTVKLVIFTVIVVYLRDAKDPQQTNRNCL